VTAIELTAARIAIGRRIILADVELAIGDGEFIGVLGPNGAGKTTLMRALLGLVPLSGGRLRVLGQPAARGNPAIGYMPQTRGATAAGRLSGWDFVAAAAGGARWGLPRLDANGRRDVARVLDLVDAAELAKRPLADLSGGERQRLLLAQALLGRPRLLLLDEPLISLDPHHQAGVVALVREVQRALGITVLFSAHELNPLLGAMDRVLYLGGGHAALGTVDEVITGPVLSRLYGSPIEVVRLGRRIFVLAGGQDVARHELEAHGHHHHA
jgi:zinc/manganese transport system ATP-binding protein